MLYATAELHLLSGEILHQQVVETYDGEVLSFAPFTCENHAMTFIPEIFLRECYYEQTSDASASSVMCAYVQDRAGNWIMLE